MTTYGYARISTPKQDIGRQVRNLLAYCPTMVLYKEQYSARTNARPRFTKLLRRVRKDGTIVFDEVSRMSRNAVEGFATYKEPCERGVSLVFLKDPGINTDVYREAAGRVTTIDADTGDEATDELVRAISDAVGRYTMVLAERQIQAAFDRSQAEIAHLSQRTREGMLTAKMKGRRVGRQKGEAVETKKAKASKPLIRDLAKRYGGQYTAEQVMRMCGISRNTYFQYCREIDAEIEREETEARGCGEE